MLRCKPGDLVLRTDSGRLGLVYAEEGSYASVETNEDVLETWPHELIYILEENPIKFDQEKHSFHFFQKKAVPYLIDARLEMGYVEIFNNV